MAARCTDAARIGDVGLQIICDWVLRFNARGPQGLIDGKAPGSKAKLDDEHRRALVSMIEAGPVHGVVPWRLIDLAQWSLKSGASRRPSQMLSCVLRTPGYRELSARPRQHSRDNGAV